MKSIRKTLATLAATTLAVTVLAASATFLCGLTGKELKQGCCQQKDGKLICTETGQTLDECCCTQKPGQKLLPDNGS